MIYERARAVLKESRKREKGGEWRGTTRTVLVYRAANNRSRILVGITATSNGVFFILKQNMKVLGLQLSLSMKLIAIFSSTDDRLFIFYFYPN